MASASPEKQQTSQHEAGSEESSKKKSGHCHGHGEAPAPDEKVPTQPAQPCGDRNGTTCSHCEAPAIAKVDSQSFDAANHFQLVSIFVPLFERLSAPQITHPVSPALSGAPPPAEWSTLLRLHCALVL